MSSIMGSTARPGEAVGALGAGFAQPHHSAISITDACVQHAEVSWRNIAPGYDVTETGADFLRLIELSSHGISKTQGSIGEGEISGGGMAASRTQQARRGMPPLYVELVGHPAFGI
jgi:hypothetical protein